MKRAVKDQLYHLSVSLVRRHILRLPHQRALRMGEFLGTCGFRLAHEARQQAHENLVSSFYERTPKELEAIVRDCFRNFGKSLVEVMRFPLLDRETVNRLVRYEGKEHLDEALELGRGVVLLTAHFGNWELLGASLGLNRYPLTVVARPLRSNTLNALLCAHREQVNMRVLFRGESMIPGLRLLKRNGILAILADVDTQSPGVFVDFFGRSAYTPYGPVAISLRTQAPLLPMFITRLADDSHRISVHRPLELITTGDWELDLQINTQRFTALIESHIRQHPEQWIWMHARWKTQLKTQQTDVSSAGVGNVR